MQTRFVATLSRIVGWIRSSLRMGRVISEPECIEIGPRAIAARAAPGVTKLIGPRAIAARAAPGVTKLIGPRAIAARAAPGVTKLIGPRAIVAVATPWGRRSLGPGPSPRLRRPG